MKGDLASALEDPDAARRLLAFIDVLSRWDLGQSAPNPRPPRSLVSGDGSPDDKAPRRRGRRDPQEPA